MSCLELDDDDILKVANPMMDDIMRGLARRDYNLHSCHFSVNLKSHGGPEAFLDMCDQHESAWGSPGQRALVAIFRKPKSFTLVWDQQYSSADGQVMAVMTVALKGGRYFVDYLLVH